jgi:hypothetical protein
MFDYDIPSLFSLTGLPEYKDFISANDRTYMNPAGIIMGFGRAIHWLSIFEVIWPDFENEDFMYLEIAYLFANDPYEEVYQESLYHHTANMIAMFWLMQLEKKYPEGIWYVSMGLDPEITLEAQIYSR